MIFNIILITISTLLIISSSYANAIPFDYCVGDPTRPHGPEGYSCKDLKQVTVDDFTYSGLRARANTTASPLKFGVTFAIDQTFPGLTGMDLAMARLDIDVGGVVPMHAHRVAELAVLVQGTVVAGFIDTNNKPYYKTLNAGDIFIFPPTLMHFQYNVGNVSAVAYGTFGSSNPGFLGVTSALFKNDLPTDILQKVTLLDAAQIKKLKAALGGTN